LPAATTNTTPAATAFAMLWLSAAEYTFCRLRFATAGSTRCDVTQSIRAIVVEFALLPPQSTMRRATSFAFFAMP
jgi:hypothetical protein